MTDTTIVLPSGHSGNGHGSDYRLTVMVPKRRYGSYLRERWWVVMICVSLALGAVLTYEIFRPESYTSFAQLYSTGQVQLNVGNIFNEESLTYYGTQIELLKSARVQSAALQRIGYVPKPGEKMPVKLEVSQPMKTSIFLLQATGTDPNLTQRFLQGIVDEYLAFKKETRRSTSEDVVLSLTDQLAVKEKDLEGEQEKWAQFQRSNNVAVLEEESRSAGLYLADLNLQVAKLKLERDLFAAGVSVTNAALNASTLNTGSSNKAPSQVSSNASDVPTLAYAPSAVAPNSSEALLNSARIDLAVARAERDRVLAERGEMAARHLQDQVTSREQRVAILEAQSRAEREANLRELDSRLQAIAASIPAWETKVLDMNERLSESQRLKNNVQREQTFYDHLMSTLQNVDLSKDVQQERFSVLQPATAAQPLNRYLPLRIGLSVGAGILVSLGIVFGWYLLDDRFVSVRDLKEQFGEPILGLVPKIKVQRSKPEEALLEDSDHRRAYAESYRHLRSALLLSRLGENRPQVLLVTGAVPAEGKTTIAVNLARVLARSGMKVVLLDADAGNSGARRLMKSTTDLGLMDYLRGVAPVEAIRQPTGQPGLHYVPPGTHSLDSEGLFLHSRLNVLIGELRKDQDFVIIDGPPILVSDDVAMLVPHSDAVVLVARTLFTRSRLVRQVLDMLYQRQAKHVALVLNQARSEDFAGRYALNGTPPRSRNGESRIGAQGVH